MEFDINNPEHGNQVVSPDNLHTDPLPEGQESFYVGEPKIEATQVPTNSVPTNPPLPRTE